MGGGGGTVVWEGRWEDGVIVWGGGGGEGGGFCTGGGLLCFQEGSSVDITDILPLTDATGHCEVCFQAVLVTRGCVS